VRKPSRVMVIRDLQRALWRMIEPQMESQDFANELDHRIIKMEIQEFVEEAAKSLRIEELADALYSPGKTMALFLEHLQSKGIAGNPIANE